MRWSVIAGVAVIAVSVGWMADPYRLVTTFAEGLFAGLGKFLWPGGTARAYARLVRFLPPTVTLLVGVAMVISGAVAS